MKGKIKLLIPKNFTVTLTITFGRHLPSRWWGQVIMYIPIIDIPIVFSYSLQIQIVVVSTRTDTHPRPFGIGWWWEHHGEYECEYGEYAFHHPHLFKSPPQVSLSLHKNSQDHQMGPPGASSADKRPLKFSRENLITTQHPQKDSVCHSNGNTEPLERPESLSYRHSRWLSVSLLMTPGAYCHWGVLTGGVLKETGEKGSTKGSTFIPLYSELRTA